MAKISHQNLDNVKQLYIGDLVEKKHKDELKKMQLDRQNPSKAVLTPKKDWS